MMLRGLDAQASADPAKWETEHVCEWLVQHDLEVFVEAFKTHKVTGPQLVVTTTPELQKIGTFTEAQLKSFARASRELQKGQRSSFGRFMNKFSPRKSRNSGPNSGTSGKKKISRDLIGAPTVVKAPPSACELIALPGDGGGAQRTLAGSPKLPHSLPDRLHLGGGSGPPSPALSMQSAPPTRTKSVSRPKHAPPPPPPAEREVDFTVDDIFNELAASQTDASMPSNFQAHVVKPTAGGARKPDAVPPPPPHDGNEGGEHGEDTQPQPQRPHHSLFVVVHEAEADEDERGSTHGTEDDWSEYDSDEEFGEDQHWEQASGCSEYTRSSQQETLRSTTPLSVMCPTAMVSDTEFEEEEDTGLDADDDPGDDCTEGHEYEDIDSTTGTVVSKVDSHDYEYSSANDFLDRKARALRQELASFNRRRSQLSLNGTGDAEPAPAPEDPDAAQYAVPVIGVESLPPPCAALLEAQPGDGDGDDDGDDDIYEDLGPAQSRPATAHGSAASLAARPGVLSAVGSQAGMDDLYEDLDSVRASFSAADPAQAPLSSSLSDIMLTAQVGDDDDQPGARPAPAPSPLAKPPQHTQPQPEQEPQAARDEQSAAAAPAAADKLAAEELEQYRGELLENLASIALTATDCVLQLERPVHCSTAPTPARAPAVAAPASTTLPASPVPRARPRTHTPHPRGEVPDSLDPSPTPPEPTVAEPATTVVSAPQPLPKSFAAKPAKPSVPKPVATRAAPSVAVRALTSAHERAIHRLSAADTLLVALAGGGGDDDDDNDGQEGSGDSDGEGSETAEVPFGADDYAEVESSIASARESQLVGSPGSLAEFVDEPDDEPMQKPRMSVELHFRRLSMSSACSSSSPLKCAPTAVPDTPGTPATPQGKPGLPRRRSLVGEPLSSLIEAVAGAPESPAVDKSAGEGIRSVLRKRRQVDLPRPNKAAPVPPVPGALRAAQNTLDHNRQVLIRWELSRSVSPASVLSARSDPHADQHADSHAETDTEPEEPPPPPVPPRACRPDSPEPSERSTLDERQDPKRQNFRLCDWFAGPVSRLDTEFALSRFKSSGHFLVRESFNAPGSFILSVVAADCQPKHIKIIEEQGTLRLMKDAPRTEVFPSLVDLVEYYKLYPMQLKSAGGTTTLTRVCWIESDC